MAKPEISIVVNYRRAKEDITDSYELSEVLLQHLAAELLASGKKLSPTKIAKWLEAQNCQLHCDKGPAVIKSKPDGSTVEEYYSENILHRDDGPAVVQRKADGSTVEEYYKNGKLHRENAPAYIERHAGGLYVEEYFRDGKHHREDGPAIIERKADGVTVEKYFLDGDQYQYVGHRPDLAAKASQTAQKILGRRFKLP